MYSLNRLMKISTPKNMSMKLHDSIHKIKQTWNDIITVQMCTPLQDTKKICYRYIKMIGRGTFGVVILVEDLLTTRRYALKKVYQDNRYHNRELDMLKKIQHKNIVNLSFYYYEEESSKGKYLNLLMEYLPYNMEYLILEQNKNKSRPDIKKIKNWCYQLINALEYLHSQGICHRDIKPANLLLDSTKDRIVLCDLGIAKLIEDGGKNVSYVCSRYYRSPENIIGLENYDCKIDIWSLGCVMLEIHTGDILFKGSSNREMMKKILKIIKCSEADLLEMGCEEERYNCIGIREYVRKIVKDEDLINIYSEMMIFNPRKRSSACKLKKYITKEV